MVVGVAGDRGTAAPTVTAWAGLSSTRSAEILLPGARMKGMGLVGAALPALKNTNPPGVQEGALVPSQKPPAPVTSNMQRAKNDGLGCVDEATIQTVSNCETARPPKDCAQQRAEFIKSQACFTILGGTTGAIEAGSHSFDWLRVRVPGTIQPLWTPRSLFLNN